MTFRRTFLCVLFALLSFASASIPAIANAQSAVRVATRLSNDHPEVGQSFGLEMIISSEGPIGGVSRPSLSVPGSMVANGPSMSMRTSTRTINGTRTSESVVSLEWNLVATDAGTFSIAGPTADVDGQLVRGNTTIAIVSASSIPSIPAFPMAGGPDPEPAQAEPDPSGTVKELAMDKAPDDKIFLRSVIDKKTAVIGEQVTIGFYIYYRQDFVMTERNEPSLSDFLRIPLVSDPNSPQRIALVGGKRFGVRMIDKAAIFPLKAGELHIGSTSARFKGRRIGDNVLRESADETITVVEPPEAGRPQGYVLGTVGRFNLTATVAPRSIEQKGSVSVNLRLDGIGNLPDELKMPTKKGVEWLDPDKHLTRTTKDDRVGGSRTFGYVAKLDEAGTIDLGSVELSYFDPASKSYQVARVPLGTVEVKPAASNQAKVDDAGTGSEDLLGKLPKVRRSLGAFALPERHRVPAWGLSSALIGPPLLVLIALGAGRAAGRVRELRRATLESGAAKCKEALRDAKAAEKSGDRNALCSSVERAIYAAIDEALGVKSRGFLREALRKELRGRGVEEALATETERLLETCEQMRFTSNNVGSADNGSAGAALVDPDVVGTGSSLIRSARELAKKFSALGVHQGAS